MDDDMQHPGWRVRRVYVVEERMHEELEFINKQSKDVMDLIEKQTTEELDFVEDAHGLQPFTAVADPDDLLPRRARIIKDRWLKSALLVSDVNKKWQEVVTRGLEDIERVAGVDGSGAESASVLDSVSIEQAECATRPGDEPMGGMPAVDVGSDTETESADTTPIYTPATTVADDDSVADAVEGPVTDESATNYTVTNGPANGAQEMPEKLTWRKKAARLQQLSNDLDYMGQNFRTIEQRVYDLGIIEPDIKSVRQWRERLAKEEDALAQERAALEEEKSDLKKREEVLAEAKKKLSHVAENISVLNEANLALEKEKERLSEENETLRKSNVYFEFAKLGHEELNEELKGRQSLLEGKNVWLEKRIAALSREVLRIGAEKADLLYKNNQLSKLRLSMGAELARREKEKAQMVNEKVQMVREKNQMRKEKAQMVKEKDELERKNRELEETRSLEEESDLESENEWAGLSYEEGMEKYKDMLGQALAFGARFISKRPTYFSDSDSDSDSIRLRSGMMR